MTDARNRQPEGIPIGGQFAANSHDGASGSLPAEPEYASPEVKTTLVLEHYDDDYTDHAVVVGEREIDLAKVLDGYSLDDLPEGIDDNGELDQFFYDAEKLGLFEGHGGAFSVRVDEDDYLAYVQSRQDAGKDDAISRIPNHSPVEHNRIVDESFDSAFPSGGFISVANWSDAVSARAWARGARDRINEKFEKERLDRDLLSPEDAEVIRNINAIADADDDTVQRSVAKQNGYFTGAQRVAFTLGDRMIERAKSNRAPF